MINLGLTRWGLAVHVDAVAESGRNPVSKHQPIRFSLSMENERVDVGREGRTRLARPILKPGRGQGNIHFPCSSAHHEQDWQPYPVNTKHTTLGRGEEGSNYEQKKELRYSTGINTLYCVKILVRRFLKNAPMLLKTTLHLL